MALKRALTACAQCAAEHTRVPLTIIETHSAINCSSGTEFQKFQQTVLNKRTQGIGLTCERTQIPPMHNFVFVLGSCPMPAQPGCCTSK